MSELCKIESPISLHLMSLNFEGGGEKKKKKAEGEKQKKGVSRREGGEEEGNEGRAPHCFGEVNTI